MLQNKNISLIKKIVHERFPLKSTKIRFIKIHGGRYQETGLPDLMVLISFNEGGNARYWLEIKRNWKDEPSDLQKFNIQDLREFGFITGYVVGDGFKAKWSEKKQKKLINIF